MCEMCRVLMLTLCSVPGFSPHLDVGVPGHGMTVQQARPDLALQARVLSRVVDHRRAHLALRRKPDLRSMQAPLLHTSAPPRSVMCHHDTAGRDRTLPDFMRLTTLRWTGECACFMGSMHEAHIKELQPGKHLGVPRQYCIQSCQQGFNDDVHVGQLLATNGSAAVCPVWIKHQPCEPQTLTQGVRHT